MGQLNSFVTLPVSHHTNPFSLNSLPCGEGQGGVCPFCCPPRSRTSLLGTKIRCNTDIRVDIAFSEAPISLIQESGCKGTAFF